MKSKKGILQMAKRRMISIDMMESDSFCTMAPSAQILYVHLMLNADDDGFVDNWKSLLRYLRIEAKHYQTLKSRGLIIETDSGLVLIADWHGHNNIRRDRYVPTRFPKELQRFYVGEDGRYYKGKSALLVDTCVPQSRLDKNRLDKSSKEERRVEEDREERNKKEEEKENEWNYSYIQSPYGESNKQSYIHSPDGEADKHLRLLSSLNMTEETYRVFINNVRLYFMRVYKTLDSNGFIEYYEARDWKNENGEIIVESYAEYADKWMQAKKEDA
jgi:hypothetical protein